MLSSPFRDVMSCNELANLEIKFIYLKIQFLPHKNIPGLSYEEVMVTCEGRTEAVKRYVVEMQKF